MSLKFHIDSRQFDKGLKAYVETTRKALPEIINQRAFNIAARTLDSMKPVPGGEQAARTRIKTYMDTQVSTRLRKVTAGKRKGQFRQRGKTANQLARVNLIIQARRARKGLKGLYGQGMKSAEAKFKQAAQVGVGFLKSPFVAVIKGLLPFVRFRKVETRWGKISVWPGSKGHGTVTPAGAGISPMVTLKTSWVTKGNPGRVQSLTLPHLQSAFDAEGREMIRHAQEKLQKEADKINAK